MTWLFAPYATCERVVAKQVRGNPGGEMVVIGGGTLDTSASWVVIGLALSVIPA